MKSLFAYILFISFSLCQNYTSTNPSRDGIGKIYLGREISKIMGHMGANWLERVSRENDERPDLVLKAMNLKSDQIVADFGAGSGYYTRRIAPLCSLVFAVDIQKEMLEINKKGMLAEGLSNAQYILSSAKKTNLPDQSIDYLIMVDVYHELEFPYETMLDIRRALKDKGEVVLVEFKEEDKRVMIKPLHKMSKKQIRLEMKNVGFSLSKDFNYLPQQHLMFFKKDK